MRVVKEYSEMASEAGGPGRGEWTMHPSFDEFVAALRNPSERSRIGLVIDDTAAAVLLGRADWASDYYLQWIALFPAVAPAHPHPPVTTTGLASTDFASTFVAAGGPIGRDSMRPVSLRRVLVLVGVAVVALLVLIGGGVAINAITTASATTSRTVLPGAPAATAPAGGSNLDAVYFHGLTKRQYDLIEALLAPQGRTLEDAANTGLSDAGFLDLAQKMDADMAANCAKGEAISGGFTDTTYQASFIAGYEVATHATPEQAVATWNAIVEYCGSMP